MAKAKINTEDAVKEINILIDSFNNLVATTNKVGAASSANFRKVETGLQALKNVSEQVDSSFKSLETRYKNMSTSQKNYVTQVRNLKEQTKELNSQIVKQQLELEKLSEKQKKAKSGFLGMTQGLKDLISAFGIKFGFEMFASIIKNAYDLTKQFNSISFTLNKITQDSFDAAASQRFMIEMAQSFGVELITTTQRWIKFLAAAKQSKVTLKDTEDIFRSVTKAASVLGLQTEELNSVYLALEQMMSKGKITTEELRRQLGERLPGAVGIMANAIGVNVSQLDKMLKNGELLSAEVLPKFARALEQAYGVENVENVDTIAAAQNRLTNTWEVFVKSVTENGSVISTTFNGISRIIGGMLKSFMSEDQKLQYDIINSQKEFQDKYESQAEKGYNNIVEANKKMFFIRNGIEKTQNEIMLAKSDGSSADRKIQLSKQLNDYRVQLAHGNDLILNIQKNQAQKDIAIAKAEYDEKKLIYEKSKKLYESIPWYKTQHGEKNIMQKAALDYSAATGKLEYLRKLTEVSGVSTFSKDDKKAKAAKVIQEFELKSIEDLNNEVKIASLNAKKDLNDALIADDKNTWAEKLAMIQENTSIELNIAKIQQDEALAKAQKYHDEQLHDLEKAIADGKKIVGDRAKWELKLEDNLNDAKELAQSDYNKKINSAKRKQIEEALKIAKLAEEEEVDISEDLFNKKIIAAKKEYAASKKTKEDKVKLDKELTNISVEEANARIEILIKNAEALIAIGGLTEDEVAKIRRNINDLRSSMKDIIPEDEIADKAKKLIDILEFAKEFTDELANFGDALFNRKIEQIDAEINAEKNKYDTLIGLAKNNKDEQERLEAEKKIKIEALEKERLKQEQRRAKFEKASALVSIALNTAIAISKVIGQTGIFGLAAWIPIAALGAVQAATVLATPIPQYAEGLDNAKTNHLAMINDGGVKEFVERDGKILSSENKNAIVQLKKGDKVHKSYDDMVASNEMFKNISRATMLTSLANKNGDLETKKLEDIFDSNFKNLNSDLKNGIRDGFKNVSIHNHTTYDMNWLKYKNDTL